MINSTMGTVRRSATGLLAVLSLGAGVVACGDDQDSSLAASTNATPTTAAPTTAAPSTDAPATDAPYSEPLATNAPATDAPYTDAPYTDAPYTDASTTAELTTAELRTAMRVLWDEHGSLTVRAIVAAVSGLDETGAVVAALQANQDKIGDAVKPFYGDEAGDALAVLLHEHIDTAVATVVAALGGDDAELQAAVAAFYANGDEIAAFLTAANPDSWPLDHMEMMMDMHLDQVVELATLQIQGDYEQALAMYETYIDHLNVGMADMLSDGIIAQFPDRLASVDSPKQAELRTAMRVLWDEHGSLTVRAIVAAVSGLDETGAVVAALQANQDKIGDAVKPFYGDEAGDALAVLLHEHIDTAVATVVAALGGDDAELQAAVAAFYANGDEIAAFLTAANPDSWPLDHMEMMMDMHLDQVVELATLQIQGDYEQALVMYETYIDHLNVGMADMLSDGIIAQFPDRF